MFDRYEIGWADLVFFLFYWVLVIGLASNLSKNGKFFWRLFLAVGFIHCVMTFFYVPFGVDSIKYYRVAKQLELNTLFSMIDQGSPFIYFFTHPWPNYFGLNYIGTSFVYSGIGLLGYFYILKGLVLLINKYGLKIKRKYYYILLLPGVHLWNVGIGKDSLIFFAISFFFFGIISKRYYAFLIAVPLIFFIRSPVLILFLTGITIGNIFFSNRVSLFQKIAIVVIAVSVSFALLPYVQDRLKLDSVDVESINEKIDVTLTRNQLGGSSVDMSNASLPSKVFGFLFRPLFFDAKSVNMLISSFENFIWLMGMLLVLKNLRYKMFKVEYASIFTILLISFLLPVIVQSTTLNNLGIAVRQKTMYYPLFVFLLFFSADFAARKRSYFRNRPL